MGEKEIVPPEYRLPLVFVGLSIIALMCAIFLFVKTVQHTEPIRFSSDEKVSSESSKFVIDVSGAVKSPGVYTLVYGSRVSDAIAIAGGFSDEADMDAVALRINQANVLSDGSKVYIPKKEEHGSQILSTGLSTLSSLSNLISINAASADELDTLTGIGPVTAKKIIDNRPYARLEELVTKKAVSQSLFDKLKNQLSL